MSKDVVIIGAGAAGMMCAIEAGKRGRRVVLIDHARKLAEKIRISGGGRCNFTNRHAKAEHFISNNPHFCHSALARFTPQDFIALLEKHGIRYHEKKLGQLFCDESSQHIIEMLKNECDDAGVLWHMSSQVERIDPCSANDDFSSATGRFRVTTERNSITASSLVVATGGLSIPQIGATALGYQIANQFGINVTSLRPGLVGLTFATEDFTAFKDIPGVSVDAEVSCEGVKFRENVLFTHRGLSGPAILQISSYWRPGNMLRVNLLPAEDAEHMIAAHQDSTRVLTNVLAQYLPKRFVQAWCSAVLAPLSLPVKPMSQYREHELRHIVDRLRDWQIAPTGTAGYKKAEVTLGGVDTHELSSKTMESRYVPGLYFIGEVVDVTGHLGGFNFQWAWSSGYAAGQVV
ncbi:NAD(P)/FAD-dependent oxidoreductase [Nitrosomonas sp. JL21]|uniref:NAD(P)/FAD-dependent oxidoreductase n=1 Tax=Nitrosomonas sp. JL21 TaxID=153949 RepID=UPI00137032DB|nr:NAD(P)/FAD-dependent oxidoreductase [Nitrosomonas sp. JL21]MBL8497921.1 NAD(P)/FAD-dependent oxidoreductase [Nitrosomonas sp.]MCC7091365.1 NAD(P)/FAD-dependent oxidoreductase [Nitrosomonas sp.]MXS78262.1 NAD(P)/FAD-dependent oxidoreductase [Nitrosomonas sp. JL21]